MSRLPLRFRQVHLDYHTSEHIPGVGSDFDPEAFVYRLQEAHVDSVTLFSRCHHGWIYHDTRFPYRHPHLSVDLLREQIRACHAADIRCPIYISVGLDERAAREEPGWVEVEESGRRVGAKPLEAGWKKLCFASPYIEYVEAQTAEVLDLFGDEVDGLFFDIMSVRGIHGPWAMAEFDRLGLDPRRAEDQQTFRETLLQRTIERIADVVRQKKPDCGMFFNSGHVSPYFKPVIESSFSHLELESLPTGGWGYSHFPIAARYARTLDKVWLGMTGKFGETWGHFNSYKPQAALEYECRLMLALGGRCSIGDQLHPRGELDAATYRSIGQVYAQIEALEPWHVEATPFAEIAVVHTEPYGEVGDRHANSNIGVYRILTECRQQFDFIDEDSDLSPYRVVILPDIVTVGPEFATKLDQFVQSGGALLLSGFSGRPSQAGQPALASAAADWGDTPDFAPGFVQVDPAVSPDLSDRAFVVYSPLAGLLPKPDAEILAGLSRPYFNRDFRHFCSHAHAPMEGPSIWPAMVKRGNVIQIAPAVFTEYAEHPALETKQLVREALGMLLPDPFVTANVPAHVQIHVLRNGDDTLIHLLNYLPERRGTRLDIVEDRLPLPATTIKVRGEFLRAISLPDQTELRVSMGYGRTEVDLPEFAGAFTILLEPYKD